MPRRVRKRYVVLGALALALLVAPVAATQVRWNGSLGHGYGSGVGVPVRVGQSFSVGMTMIHTNHAVRIESVRLHHPDGRVALVGALVGRVEHERFAVGTARGFPPSPPGASLRTAYGAVIPAHADVELVLGFRATGPGIFRVRGVDVRYRERWPGVEVKRLTHSGVLVVGCAVPAGAKRANCRVPSMNP